MKPASVMLLAFMSALSAITYSASQESKPTYTPTGNEGKISGVISFTGEARKPRPISVEADSECVKWHSELTAEDVIVTDGKVANVLVYVKGGELDSYKFVAPSSPATLEREGCQLIPHVLGVQTGQPFMVLNRSTTTHNTNVQPVINPKWNISQPPGRAPIEKTFEAPERPVRINDNQHPWESAYLGVFSHPFFAVTGKGGSYAIAGLPVGEYVIVAWHEKFGELEVKVFVGAGEERKVDFDFKASER